jgi:small subunit ribosomal protein S8
MVLDYLSDMLVRIKNGYKSKKQSVVILYSKQNFIILMLLLKLGYISNIKFLNSRDIEVVLFYYKGGHPAIRDLRRISKIKHRIYMSVRDLKNRSSITSNQNGFIVLSTVKGIITDIEAMLYGVGGEVLFQIV